MNKELVLLGVDPGTIKTGYGIIHQSKTGIDVVDYGVIKPDRKLHLFDRYHAIFEDLKYLIQKFKPGILVVETQFVQKNVQSALKLGMARGVAIIAGKQYDLDCYEYSPKQAKLAVVGTGSASKYQVQKMLQRQFSLSKEPPEDAADALALALCHLHRHRNGLNHV